jgi:hypothetical protein
VKRPPGTEVDYRDELNAEEKEFLAKFDRETIFGYFKKGEKPLFRKRSKPRAEIEHTKHLRRCEREYPLVQVDFDEKTARAKSPEDVLIRGIDACSSKGLAAHLKKIPNKE